MRILAHRRAAWLPALLALCLCGLPAPAAASPIHHVFTIVLENESASTTFGSASPAPYLSKTLVSEGAFLPNYYGIGHASNDNYIAMVSGQAPNPQTQGDCPYFNDFPVAATGADGQELGTGCVYPRDIQTIAGQLDAAGLSWRDYNEDMGADPSREAPVCAHPAIGAKDDTQTETPADGYATRHNPFVYFHSVIDDSALCDANVVNLDQLPGDLASAANTPNYVFITPNLCDDGHNTNCANGDPGGLPQADAFLQKWVPQITGSPAFRQDGLLMVIFDEAASSDASSCCGEIAGPGSPLPGITGSGGGRTGAVLLSPCIAPGTVTETAYNHYSMLRSVEDIFGLSHLAYAALPGEASFGADIFNRACGPSSPSATIRAPRLLSSVSTRARVPLSWSASSNGGSPVTYTVSERDLSQRAGAWKTLASGTSATSLSFPARLGHTYSFQVTATDAAGQTGAPAVATTTVPSGARPAHSHFSGRWKRVALKGAWQGRAVISRSRRAGFSARFSGDQLWVIGTCTGHSALLRVRLDGRSRTVHLHSGHRHQPDRVAFSRRVKAGAHRFSLEVLRGSLALEGLGAEAPAA